MTDYLVQHVWLDEIEGLKESLKHAHEMINHYDTKAIELYKESIGPDAHNPFTCDWSELTEPQKDSWRYKALN